MDGKTKPSSLWLSYFAICIAGFFIGALVGLSVSPVLKGVVTGVIGSAVAIVAALSGIEKKYQINPWPLTVLVVGLTFGAGLGIYARTHSWLEPHIDANEISNTGEWLELQVAIDEWSKLLGQSREEVALAIFEHQYLNLESEFTSFAPSEEQIENVGGLYVIGRELDQICGTILPKIDRIDNLREDLENYPKSELRVLAEIEKDEVLVRIIRDVLCTVEQEP